MKTKNLLLVLLLFASVWSGAQKYVPFPTENAEWNIMNVFGDFNYGNIRLKPDTILNQYFLKGDTTINGIAYHKVSRNIGTIQTPVYKGIGGFREQDKKVYYIGGAYSFFDGYFGKEVVLYDFNKQVGDVLWLDKYTLNYEITAIDSIKIGTEYRKRFRVESGHRGTCYIIEGIGNVSQGPWAIFAPVSTCLCWDVHNLICFSQNGESVYKNPEFKECNSTLMVETNSYFGNNSCWSYKALVYQPMGSDYYLPRTISIAESISGDTLINSIFYKKFIGDLGKAAIRQLGQKVYAKTPDQDNEFLLYDFSVKAGDVITSNSHSGYLSEIQTVGPVDSVVMYNGEKRKRIRVYGDEWIEGIGSVRGFMNPLRNFLTCGCNSSYELISFAKEDHVKFYNSALAANFYICGGILDEVEKISVTKNSVVISPNPATDFIKLEFQDPNNRCLSVDMMDFQGRKINSKPFSGNKEMSIDLTGFKAGIYFVLVRFDKTTEVYKMIKK